MPSIGGGTYFGLVQGVGQHVLAGDGTGQYPFAGPAQSVTGAPAQAAAHGQGALRYAAAQPLLRFQQPAGQRQAKCQDRRDQQVAKRRCGAQHQQPQAEHIAAAGPGQHPGAARVGNEKAGKILHLMRHKPDADGQLADGKPHGGPQPAAAAQLHQHHGQQRKQRNVLYHTYAGVRRDQQQGPQPK